MLEYPRPTGSNGLTQLTRHHLYRNITVGLYHSLKNRSSASSPIIFLSSAQIRYSPTQWIQHCPAEILFCFVSAWSHVAMFRLDVINGRQLFWVQPASIPLPDVHIIGAVYVIRLGPKETALFKDKRRGGKRVERVKSHLKVSFLRELWWLSFLFFLYLKILSARPSFTSLFSDTLCIGV